MTSTGELRADLRGAATVEYPPGASFGPHTLTTFELVWLLQGEAEWHRHGPDEDVVALDTRTLLLSRPGVRESFRWDTSRATRHAYAHVDLSGTGPVGDWPYLRPIALDDPVAALLTYLIWLSETQASGWRERANDVLQLLVATFVDGPLPPPGATEELPPAIAAVADLLARRWRDGVTDPVSLAELAAAGSVSTGQLSRVFRARFGVGPVAAVELLRLARAEGLLLRSNATIGAIARDCGFGDQYHFSKRFRHAYGVPPREYRNSGRRNGPEPTPAGRRTLRPLARRVWGGQ